MRANPIPIGRPRFPAEFRRPQRFLQLHPIGRANVALILNRHSLRNELHAAADRLATPHILQYNAVAETGARLQEDRVSLQRSAKDVHWLRFGISERAADLAAALILENNYRRQQIRTTAIRIANTDCGGRTTEKTARTVESCSHLAREILPDRDWRGECRLLQTLQSYQ